MIVDSQSESASRLQAENGRDNKALTHIVVFVLETRNHRRFGFSAERN